MTFCLFKKWKIVLKRLRRVAFVVNLFCKLPFKFTFLKCAFFITCLNYLLALPSLRVHFKLPFSRYRLHIYLSKLSFKFTFLTHSFSNSNLLAKVPFEVNISSYLFTIHVFIYVSSYLLKHLLKLYF